MFFIFVNLAQGGSNADFVSCAHQNAAKDGNDFQLYPCFNGLPSESLDEYAFEVEALVAGTKDDEKKPIGLRLVRRLGGVPGALAKRELHMPDLAKPEGYKLSWCLEKRDTRKMLWTGDFLRIAGMRLLRDALDRPCKTSLRENMAYADAVKTGVGIDPDRRADHMLTKSGLTDDPDQSQKRLRARSQRGRTSCISGSSRDSGSCTSGSTTDPGTWTDTVIREHPWADAICDGACGNDAPTSDVVSSTVQG